MGETSRADRLAIGAEARTGWQPSEDARVAQRVLEDRLLDGGKDEPDLYAGQGKAGQCQSDVGLVKERRSDRASEN